MRRRNSGIADYRQLHRDIREALWRVDPAGVEEDRSQAPEEYDGLALALLALVTKGQSEEEVRSWLREELEVNWGLTDVVGKAERIVDRMRPLSHRAD